MRLRLRSVAVLACAAALAGCGGPATFVSADPPPVTKAEAWFLSTVPNVHSAMRQAMVDNGLEVEPGAEEAQLVGTKKQLPFVDEDSQAPAEGPLPVYHVTADIKRTGETYVSLVLMPECSTCGGSTEYEWEYPGDILRDVLNEAQNILLESRARFVYQDRFRPETRRRHHR